MYVKTKKKVFWICPVNNEVYNVENGIIKGKHEKFEDLVTIREILLNKRGNTYK